MENINLDAESHHLITLEVANQEELDALMTDKEYDAFITKD